MDIKNYGVVIDTKNYGCGVIIDPSEYNISFLGTSFLNYSVEPNKKQIRIFDPSFESKEILLKNTNEELIYHAFKTDVFVVFIGDRFCKSPPISCYEAVLG